MEAMLIRTPTVRSQVRAHFDCPEAEGAPLENQGGAGTASSHWEETAFFSEVRVPLHYSFARFWCPVHAQLWW